MNIPTLAGDGFVLRAFREDDVPAMTAPHSDPDVMRYLRPNGAVETRPRQAWDFIAEQLEHWQLKVMGSGRWPIAARTG